LNPKVIVFADLDGTILNDNYNYTEIQPIIRKLQSLRISIILASSKTRAEVEFYRRKLRINEPFIAENGSAIFIPKNYFGAPYKYTKETACYHVIELGIDYSTLRKKIEIIMKKSNAQIVGFGDMTIKEIAEDSGLPITLASLSKKREYDEPFKIVEGCEADVLCAIEDLGLCYTKGGRYFHLLGNTDKGKALVILKQLYLQEYRKIVTVGVGDGPNDLSMLDLVNKPFLINDKKSPLTVWQEILEIAEAYA
jgi:mannosyl-3-phosphoglycerate phosphatase